MEVGISHDGSMVIRDSEGKRHIFCPLETRVITRAIYVYVQKKKRQVGVLIRGGEVIDTIQQF